MTDHDDQSDRTDDPREELAARVAEVVSAAPALTGAERDKLCRIFLAPGPLRAG